MNTQAYVYKWTELSTGKWYIGSRSRKNCNPNDGYICSSKIVKPMIIANKDNWVREVLCIGIPEDMRTLEAKYLQALKAADDPMSYNQQNQDGKFSNAGKPHSDQTRKKISTGNKGKIRTEETRKKLSEQRKGKPGRKGEQNGMYGRAPWNKGKPMLNHVKLALKEANKDRGPWNKGVPMTDEAKLKLSISKTGSKASIETKLKMSASGKGRKDEKVTCPNCGLTGGNSGMKRYHFDNCKYKENK